jgi:hypothetical protein
MVVQLTRAKEVRGLWGDFFKQFLSMDNHKFE